MAVRGGNGGVPLHHLSSKVVAMTTTTEIS